MGRPRSVLQVSLRLCQDLERSDWQEPPELFRGMLALRPLSTPAGAGNARMSAASLLRQGFGVEDRRLLSRGRRAAPLAFSK